MPYQSMRPAAPHRTLLSASSRTLVLAMALSLSSVVTAADSGDKATRFYESGLQRFEKNDLLGAVIELKNALQQDSRKLSAHILLGKVYLRTGDAAGAEVSLNKALQFGVDPSEIIVPLAQAYLGQGKHKTLLERLRPDGLSDKRKIDVLVLRAEAQAELKDFAAAERSLGAASDIDSRSVTVLGAEATLKLTQNDRVGAEKLAERAVELAPDDAKAWNTKASVAHAIGNLPSALSAYSKTLSLDPAEANARIARASLFLDLDRVDDAGRDIEVLLKDSLGDPRVRYIQSVYLARKGDSPGAAAALREITKIADAVHARILVSRPQLTLLGGLAHYGLNQQVEAKTYLEKYVSLDRGHPGARKLLASLYLDEGNTKAAISVLEPAYRNAPRDYRVLSLLATAYMAQRQYAKANTLLEQAVELSGSLPELQATLGFSLLGKGEGDLALEHLRRAFAKDPSQSRAGAALVLLNIRRGQAKQAVEVAAEVARQEPSNAMSHNLLGVARVAAGDRVGGRAAYERAVALDRAFVSAHLNLGKLDLADNEPAKARDRFVAVLKAQPRNTAAMFELARLEDGAGNTEEAIRWLDKLRAVNARDVDAGKSLVELHLRKQDVTKALEVAKEINVKVPENLGAMLALGRAHIAAGEIDLARIVFNRMTKLAEFDAAAQVDIARYQLAAKNVSGAIYSLEKALSSKPDSLAALTLMTEVEIGSGELAKAEQRARFTLGRFPKLGVGHRLLADVARAKKNYVEAVSGYRAALAKEETAEGALRLYRAYAESGDTAKAKGLMESWVRRYPRDGNLLRALADADLRLGDLRAARATYETLLKLEGEGPLVLNNLANILLRQGDSGALAHAERAQRLAPDDAEINDTLGWVLVQQGQLERGLRHLRDARLRDPQNREIRYHLAEALKRAGRYDEAKRELEPAIKASLAFDGDNDATKLWRELSQ